jgi:hypothetical protein
VFEKTDPLYPVSDWYPSKAKAVEELRRRGGLPARKKKEEEIQPVDILGYPWEYIQALQQKASPEERTRILRKHGRIK